MIILWRWESFYTLLAIWNYEVHRNWCELQSALRPSWINTCKYSFRRKCYIKLFWSHRKDDKPTTVAKPTQQTSPAKVDCESIRSYIAIISYWPVFFLVGRGLFAPALRDNYTLGIHVARLSKTGALVSIEEFWDLEGKERIWRHISFDECKIRCPTRSWVNNNLG